VASGRSHPELFLTLPRIASKTNGPLDQAWRGSLNATYPGSFIALIPDHSPYERPISSK